ncbi:uncharacterized protein LOC142954760 [Anarhichas minor]|uniref:uncharacterized protein LOC142954760 n=1 Tax=Anarhichas minor TaxID=65739 RepID=UPI003F73E0BF
MKSVSLLCYLVKLLVRLFMAMFNFNLLYSAYGWVRRTLCFCWRFTKRIFNPISEYLFLRIPWRKDTGSQGELGVNAEDRPTERRFSDQDEESHSPEGQHEAACRERTADSHRELTCKRPRFEEDDDEFDSDEYRVEPTDELYCGYDSRWETEEPQRGKVTRTKRPAVYNSPVRQQRRNTFSDTGSQGELGVNAEDRPTERRFSDQDEESHSPEGQHEAACRERTADSHRELTCKRPRFEEDGDEFDGDEYRVEPTDELYCGYDSTWETEEPQRGKVTRTKRPAVYNYMFDRFENAAKDMQNYRHDYPSPVRQQRRNQVSDAKPNLQFYLGVKCSVPDGVYIGGFHTDWYGQYNSLESVHSYIQWLFPLQEPGMNYEASTLTKEEITEFCQSDTAKANLVKSYKLMLDFYGIELCDEETGEVKRAFNWRDRFNNLNSRLHNNLRITRILKCLGTLGYRHYQAPLVRFFLEETLVHGQLPDVKISVLNYFVFAVLDKRERRSLIKFAYFRYDRKEEFVWCPKKIQTTWSQQGMEGRKEACELDLNRVSLYNEDESQDGEN